MIHMTQCHIKTMSNFTFCDLWFNLVTFDVELTQLGLFNDPTRFCKHWFESAYDSSKTRWLKSQFIIQLGVKPCLLRREYTEVYSYTHTHTSAYGALYVFSLMHSHTFVWYQCQVQRCLLIIDIVSVILDHALIHDMLGLQLPTSCISQSFLSSVSGSDSQRHQCGYRFLKL